MKKSILAIFLAVIAMAQVHAQDSDLRSAPDLPTFKVTLNYSSANTDQGTITSTVATGSKVAYNSKPVFTITAKPGYVLSDITMNTATIGTLPSGTFQNDNTTTYSYTSTALTGSTEIKAVFKAKEQVTVTISPEYATLDEIRAKVNLPKVTFDPVITGYKVQYREDGSAALTDELPEKAGLYYVVVTKSETDTQAAINKEILFKVQPPHTLSYSFEEAQGSVTASMDGSIIASGDEIVYNKPAVLKIASKPGYVLSRLTVDNNEVTLPKGTFNSSTNETSYADYTTSALTASTVIDVRFAAKKTVSVTANPLSATKDEVLAGKNLPVITFTPNTIAGQKVQYKNASGALSDKLPAADGVYTIVATSPETAEYAALKDENMKFTVSKANVLNYNVETAGQGTVTAKMGSTDMASGNEIINGQPAVFTIIANPGFLLNKIVVNGTAVSALPKGALNKDNTISYTYTTASLTASTTLSVGFAAKKTISVSVTGSSATKDEIVAGKNLPVIKFTPEIAGQVARYRAADGSETSTLPQIVGAYKIVLFSPETMEYAALEDSSKTFTIRNANTLAYAVDGGQGTVTAKMDNKDIISGGEIAYGKPVIFSIVSNANYRLGAIKQASSDVDISKIKGTYANGNTSYTYTTPSLTSGDSYTFAFVSKDTVRFVANNLVQTVGSIKPVTVTSAVEDIKIEYQLSGKAWVTTLPSTLAVGSYKARLSRAEDLTYRSLSDTVTLVVESKKEVENLVLPTISGRIEEGQSLSAYVLTGGSTSGTFSWKNPNDTISAEESTEYGLIYEPSSPLYAVKDTFIKLRGVVPVYTMLVTAGSNGSVKLEGRTANDRYAGYSRLTATAIADKNYVFVKWSDGNTSANRTLEATKNRNISAEFAPIEYEVTFDTPSNGSLNVYANGERVTSGKKWLQGTLLTITVEPKAGYKVQAVKVNDALVNNGSYTLIQDADIAVTFERIVSGHLVKVGSSLNGSVALINTKTKAPITPGDAVNEDVKVKVITKADYGYKMNSVKVEGAIYSPADSTFTVGKEEVKVDVTFGLAQFEVKKAMNLEGAGTIVLKSEGVEVDENSGMDYKKTLTATVTVNEGYRFVSLMVNSTEIKSGESFTVTGPMTVTANFVEKKDLSGLIEKAPQTLVYNKLSRSFSVRLEGYSGLNFDVSYSLGGAPLDNPKSAGTYDVTISRAEDDLYKKVENVTSQLIITKADMALLEEPSVEGNTVTAELTQDFAGAIWNPSEQRSALRAATGSEISGSLKENAVNRLRFMPLDSKNYNPVDYSILRGSVENSFALTTENTEVTNGGLVVATRTFPEGTELRLRAVPGANERFIKWKEDNRTNVERTVTMSNAITLTPLFEKKQEVKMKDTEPLSFTYDGSIHLVGLDDILAKPYPKNVTVKYTNLDGSVATPMNAGTYLVVVSYAGDDDWAPFANDIQGKRMVINKAKVDLNALTAPTASEITEGQALSESVLSGGVAKAKDGTTISGKFEWADASAILKPGDNQKKKVIFTSYDPNYEDATTEAEVTVKSSDALVITFAQPENGSLKVYMLKGEGEKTEITSGTAVAEATKLTVEAEAYPDYELAVIQIGEEKYTTSPVEIEVDKSLAIMAEFKPVSTPPGTDVAVTGVSLNITSKALAVGESFALQAKVTPDNATMKTVSWSSSDETVATVDADGVVTALKIGTCKITVATDDGNKTASCVVTVSGTVGIEQIINDHQIYCERGAITVHPARPISIRIIAVTGVSLYGDSIIGTTRIPVSTGIYLVEIIENGKRMTTKVNVR